MLDWVYYVFCCFLFLIVDFLFDPYYLFVNIKISIKKPFTEEKRAKLADVYGNRYVYDFYKKYFRMVYKRFRDLVFILGEFHKFVFFWIVDIVWHIFWPILYLLNSIYQFILLYGVLYPYNNCRTWQWFRRFFYLLYIFVSGLLSYWLRKTGLDIRLTRFWLTKSVENPRDISWKTFEENLQYIPKERKIASLDPFENLCTRLLAVAVY